MGVGTTALGWTLGAVLVAAGAIWLAYVRPRRAGLGGGESDGTHDGAPGTSALSVNGTNRAVTAAAEPS